MRPEPMTPRHRASIRRRETHLACAAVALMATLSAAGCATDSRLREGERKALYLQHAGAPVPSFRHIGSINGWTPLGDDMLAIWTRPSEAVLLTLNGPCPELDFATAISLTSQFRTVYAKFDRVVPIGSIGSASIVIPCPIREIRPLDVRALRDAQREMRKDVREAPRDEAAPAR
ncbi:DUF6491 family protein [Cognatilysobacter bugurensis]|uniref:Uncharacterized protein n=1 Tax=Cognatilysobacter bugurensis TaxID=543356 RepID=A0A918W820_9GAMM|nr:DUF6491 family protein [Lysobacter bugurensis]GHA76022.1 hypothetical protein GCM10007067_11530 [Lysobacter bugurensis]